MEVVDQPVLDPEWTFTRADFLFAYWLGRAAGALTPDVEPAPAVVPPAAPPPPPPPPPPAPPPPAPLPGGLPPAR